MISGLHAILYAQNADKVCVFLRDTLGLKSVDAGHGWRIFAAPPAELAAHPIDEGDKPHHELFLMCDDLKNTMADLKAKGVQCGEVTEAAGARSRRFICPAAGNLACTSLSTRRRLGSSPPYEQD